jgi:hypothetical protein
VNHTEPVTDRAKFEYRPPLAAGLVLLVCLLAFFLSVELSHTIRLLIALPLFAGLGYLGIAPIVAWLRWRRGNPPSRRERG